MKEWIMWLTGVHGLREAVKRDFALAVMLWLTFSTALLMVAAACNTKQPPRPDAPVVQQVQALVKTMTAAGCMFMPASEQEAARQILPTVLALAKRDPTAAYDLLSKNPEKARAFGYLWAGLHEVIDIIAATPAEWVRFTEDSIVPAAEGCLGALGVAV